MLVVAVEDDDGDNGSVGDDGDGKYDYVMMVEEKVFRCVLFSIPSSEAFLSSFIQSFMLAIQTA